MELQVLRSKLTDSLDDITNTLRKTSVKNIEASYFLEKKGFRPKQRTIFPEESLEGDVWCVTRKLNGNYVDFYGDEHEFGFSVGKIIDKPLPILFTGANSIIPRKNTFNYQVKWRGSYLENFGVGYVNLPISWEKSLLENVRASVKNISQDEDDTHGYRFPWEDNVGELIEDPNTWIDYESNRFALSLQQSFVEANMGSDLFDMDTTEEDYMDYVDYLVYGYDRMNKLLDLIKN